MQKICAAPGGVKAYLAHPDGLLGPEARECPFCSDGHRLRIHGWYRRFALLPDPEPAVEIPIRRLLCPATGRTVSLLPDFCLPRRQHGPHILGLFLAAWALDGRFLLESLRAARRDAAWHSVAQSLLRGFLRRLPPLQTYLASLRPRPIPAPKDIRAERRSVTAALLGLREGFCDLAAAFVQHGRVFHARFGLGLA